MLRSHIIEVGGTFVGVAISLENGYRFVATDVRLEQLDEAIVPTLADVQRLAQQLYVNGSLAEPRGQPMLVGLTP